MSEPTRDPMGILLVNLDGSPKQSGPIPWLVTCQWQFRVESKDKIQAEGIVIRNTSIGALLVQGLISQGIHAEPLTAQLIAEFKAQLEKESR